MTASGSAPSAPPSGEQYELAHGELRAVVVEVGGGIRTLQRGAEHWLAGYERHELCPSGAGQVLAPWPNRLRDGSYEHDGTRHQLPLSEPKYGNAIHGLTRWEPWRLVEHTPSSATLRYVLHPRPGYPFRVELTTTWSLDAKGLRVEHDARNLGDASCPFGLGVHPYLSLEGRTVDDLLLALPAARYYPTDARKLPLASVATIGSKLDYTQRRRIGSAVLDTAFADCARDRDGIARVTVGDEHGRGLELWMDSAFTVVQVFTGDTLALTRRRRSLAVEPMSCAPDAFNTGEGLTVLQPGASWRGAWGIAAR
jgi:aldose 1-epimerase